jgi:hypothetical protein
MWWVSKELCFSNVEDASHGCAVYGGRLRWGSGPGPGFEMGRARRAADSRVKKGKEMCVPQVCWAFCRDCDVRCTAAAGMKRCASAEVAVRSVWGFTFRTRSARSALSSSVNVGCRH